MMDAASDQQYSLAGKVHGILPAAQAVRYLHYEFKARLAVEEFNRRIDTCCS